MDLTQQRFIEGSTTAEDAVKLVELANQLGRAGDLHGAATSLDRAFGLAPTNSVVRQNRQDLLDRLAVKEHGLVFRYIPAGAFLMGSTEGDRDEQPVHAVNLDHYWLTETPISWADFCCLMEWEPPPNGLPKDAATESRKQDNALWAISAMNRVRLQYCEDETLRARDWHSHARGQMWQKDGKNVSSQESFGSPERSDPNKPWGYIAKPMIAVSFDQAEKLCFKLSPPAKASDSPGFLSKLFGQKGATANVEGINYRLPTEAEWEKAARGGLIGCRYPWGNQLPTNNNCDFGRFDQFSILPMKRFPPNDYGLYAMSGCVWEWTNDWYDAEFFPSSPLRNPRGPSSGQQKVIRGGSWADSLEAVTTSFRMSMTDEGSPNYANPNVGFRLCRDGGSSNVSV